MTHQDAYATHNIKFLVLDVDGVMTDGGMYYTESGDQFKKFNTKDGMGIRTALKNGLEVAFLSSGSTEHIVQNRAKTLKVNRVYVGSRPKIEVLNEWCDELGITPSNVAYVGDDINDSQVFDVVGLSACPADAVKSIAAKANIILKRNGGNACVREFIDEHLLN
ncbi:MAG: 3-deoxy-D-manno-octulosonate 8-phosphate phosphatase (KDO 8-P phosphatase) [Bacteroidia bacterium]|jgi:3-deoxy-D-manno-octulosonate 8-phosphate phosphatase (KDO 8-P phosphatase)